MNGHAREPQAAHDHDRRQQFTTTDDEQEASSLLRLAGADPARFDLARSRTGPPSRSTETSSWSTSTPVTSS